MKKTLYVLLALFCALLLGQNGTAMRAARDGLFIWCDQVLPALFPFFVCTEMLQRLGGTKADAASLFCMSMLSGAPSGARLCAAYEGLDRRRRTDLVAALNAAGPMYVYGAFCGGMMHLPRLALPILLSQYLSAGIMLLSCRPFSLRLCDAKGTTSGLQMFSESLYGGMRAMLSIGAAIIFFKVALRLLEALGAALLPATLPPLVKIILTGALEMVNGCTLLANAHLPPAQAAAVAAFLFSFGGLCILAQSACFVEVMPLRYLGRKLIAGLLAAAGAYVLTPLFLRAQAVFFNPDPQLLVQNAFSALTVCLASSAGMAVVWLLHALVKKRGTVYKRSPEAEQ